MAEKIVIASGKGGVGKSTVVSGISAALATMNKRVLIFDMDIGLRSLDLILGIENPPIYDWGDVLQNRCDVYQAIAEENGISLLSAPMYKYPSATSEALKNLSDLLDSEYDFIFFDSPAGIGEGLQLAAAGADSSILVSTPDPVCCRSASRAGDELYNLGIRDQRLVINRFIPKAVNKNQLLNIDRVIDAAGARLLGVVPEDFNLLSHTTTEEPVSLSSDAGKAFNNIAKRLLGQETSLKHLEKR